MHRAPNPPKLKVLPPHVTHATPCDSCPTEQPASVTVKGSVGRMVNLPTAQLSRRPYVCPCGTISVKASKTATWLSAASATAACCRNTDEVSLMDDAAALSEMVHTIDGSGTVWCISASPVHGDVRVPFGVVTATPTLKAGSGTPTAAAVAGAMHCCTVRSVAGMVRLSGAKATPDERCWHATTNVTLRVAGDVCTTNRGTAMTPVCGSVGMDASDVSVEVASATTKLVAGVDDVTEQLTSATTAASWRVTTPTTSGGSSGQGDDASDAMKVDGSADRMRTSNDAVVRCSGGGAST